MDRAHRIGQKRVVSVYRLITRHTLEEKIMSLQRFKLHTARTVISADNASLHTMATDQVINHIFSRPVCRLIPVFSRSCLLPCFLPQEV
jgi:SNF2 family DNA or RNA helicase